MDEEGGSTNVGKAIAAHSDRPEIVQVAEVEEALMLGTDAIVLFTALGATPT